MRILIVGGGLGHLLDVAGILNMCSRVAEMQSDSHPPELALEECRRLPAKSSVGPAFRAALLGPHDAAPPCDHSVRHWLMPPVRAPTIFI